MDTDRYNCGSIEYDSLFSHIGELTWLPWVGKNYSNAKRKILFVAESHYSKDNQEQIEVAKSNMKNDLFLTREVVVECPIDHYWQNNMFDNLHRCLTGTTDFDTNKLWNEIAFYNFVQKPMDYNGEQWEKERPTKKDFLQGWRVFVEIVKILRPTDCIFIGVTASNTFDQFMDFAQIKYTPVVWTEGQGAYGRTFSLSMDNYLLNCVSIKHASKYFSWEFWNSFLWKYCRNAMSFIQETLCVPVQPNLSNNFHSDISWIQDVPIRKHKPIIACKYEDIDEYGDAKYLTIGKAQYDNENDASIKVWRWDDKNHKWSRQSEELPINRIFDVAILLATTIHSIQSGGLAPQSYLGEAILNEEDIAFLEGQISDRAQHIKQSLLQLKSIINKLDINAI